MAVLSNTGVGITPIATAETDVVAISPGSPLDMVSVYVQGGAQRMLEYALYATVGTARTRVAQAEIMGTNTPSVIAWQTIGRGDGQTEQVDAGGTIYTVTVLDISQQLGVSQPVTVTIAGVDTFDTVGDQNFSAVFGLGPGATGTLTTFNGYAQQMDVALDQRLLPPVIVEVLADCGPGSVQVTVKSVSMSGQDEGIASVFRGLQLPVATRYFVSVTNESNVSVTTTLAAVTYSVSASSGGGVVTLSPDVIGPSNANEVVQWAHVPLTLAGSGTFTTPVDAAVPIYDIGTNTWRAFALSGGATMTNAGVVTVNAGAITLAGDVTGPANANTVVRWENQPLDPVTMGAPALNDVPTWNGTAWVAATGGGGAVTLTGNANGPSGANTVESFVTSTTDANVNVGAQPHPSGLIYEGLNGLTANRTVSLTTAFVSGDETTVKDEDGSLASFNIIVDPGAGNTIDGAATYTMTAVQNGVKGASTFKRISATAWAIV